MSEQTTSSLKETPAIFEYFDYRKYLQAYLVDTKTRRPGFSMRAFSRFCGFNSPNYMSLILSARRNLSPQHIVSISKACRLDRLEARYFKALVEWNQSRAEDRNHYFDELYRIQLSRSQKVISQSQQVILGKWYYHVLREMVLLPQFHNDPHWISQRLGGRVSVDDVDQAMRLLVAAGFLKEQNGRLIQCDPVITTTNDVQSLLIQQFHMEMIPQAVQAIKHNAVEDRDFRGMTMAISKEAARKIKKELKALEERIIQIASSERNAEEIYQLNVQLFHHTQKVKSEGTTP